MISILVAAVVVAVVSVVVVLQCSPSIRPNIQTQGAGSISNGRESSVSSSKLISIPTTSIHQ